MTDVYDIESRELDLKIAKALQIDVPELVMPELPAIKTENVTALPTRKRSLAPLWFAVAATVVLATSISLRMSDMFQSYDSLAEEILAHMDHEPGALRVTDIAVPNERLARVVPASVAQFDRDKALITYAQPCTIRGKTSPHLVVQGEYGPVTIILMPEVSVAERTLVEGENVKGVILPVGDGSIAIIGSRDEVLEPIQKNVVDSVTWTT